VVDSSLVGGHSKRHLEDPGIVNGVPAKPGEFPFFVATVPPGNCGASLIAPDVVLTAGHCEGTRVRLPLTVAN
jgi:secreted trypsin-like serine protease